MVDALTTSIWLSTLKRIQLQDPSANRLARMMTEIIEQSDDPVVGKVLDRHLLEIMQ